MVDSSAIFLKWYKDERKIQSDFLNDIFGKILGYEFETDNDEYNLDKERKTDKGHKQADGILGLFSKENRKVKAIVELKGKNIINLDTI